MLPLRVREKITSDFRIPSSGHFRSLLGRKILELALLVLRFCSRGSSKPGAEAGREKPEVTFSRTLTVYGFYTARNNFSNEDWFLLDKRVPLPFFLDGINSFSMAAYTLFRVCFR